MLGKDQSDFYPPSQSITLLRRYCGYCHDNVNITSLHLLTKVKRLYHKLERHQTNTTNQRLQSAATVPSPSTVKEIGPGRRLTDTSA